MVALKRRTLVVTGASRDLGTHHEGKHEQHIALEAFKRAIFPELSKWYEGV